MASTVIELMRGARARKAPLSTLIEVLRMRFGSQRLSAQEYISYQFHESCDLSASERSRFLGGNRKYRLNLTCNDPRWFMLGQKLPMTLFMMGTGLQMPRVHAVYDLDGRNLPGAVRLRNRNEVIAYLRQAGHYPLFVKPSHGSYGGGAVGLKNYLPESDSLVFLDDRQSSLPGWADSLKPGFAQGILFQEMLQPHPEIARICGPRVSSVRVSTARSGAHVSLVSAVWRIPTGTNMIDNFQHGASGNLLGGVDTTTGSITRVVGQTSRQISLVDRHPDTGVKFDGFVLPDWQEVVSMCSRAADHLMGMNLHHWDIALTDHGPVIVENNEWGDHDLHQHANRKGFWSTAIEDVRRQSYPRYWQTLGPLQRIAATVMRRIDAFR